MRLRNWLRPALPTAPFNKPRPSLGVYVHWPFCAALCPYCDFNVHLAAKAGPESWQDWAGAYHAELTHAHGIRADGPVETVFFGGGTPSLMSADLVAAILTSIDRLWGLATTAEVSLEANPMSAPQVHLADLRAAGVTRLSLGVQAFDDAALKELGRTHNAADARQAFAAAQSLYPRSSFDMMYARSGQSLTAWQDELRAALALGGQHMSLYQLSIEPGTVYDKWHQSGRLNLPDEGLAADMYEATQELCSAAGLPAYEISNHAAAGHACRHNMASWQGGDYIGIGPGAHGRVTRPDGTRLATVAARAPQDWLAQTGSQGHGWQSSTALSAAEATMEAVLLGLRLSAGLALADLQARGIELQAARLQEARRLGLLSDDPSRLQASPQGRLLLDTLTGLLLA